MKVIVDRFEENCCICEDEEGDIVSIDKGKLPAGIKEGDVLIISGESIILDREASAGRRKEIDELVKDMWK